MGDLCSFCDNPARYYTVSKENQMVARCKNHADTDVPKCMVCDSESTKRLPAEDGGNESYYCEAHP